MRTPSDMPRRRPRSSGRGRVVIIVVGVALFLLITSVRQIAEFWTDYLWFDGLGFSSVWAQLLSSKVFLGLGFSVVLFLVLYLNLLVVDRLGPRFRLLLGPEDEVLLRYHQVIDRRAGTLRLVVAAAFALLAGVGMSSQWNDWLLFTHPVDFPTTDPIFGINAGFYVFRLPFLVATVDWLFAALVIVLLVTAVAYYLTGGIRLQAPFERVAPQVKVHLSILLALLALTKAADYWLQRYELLFSQRGVVNGATYTEVNAQLPALNLLLFIALAAFVLFLVNIRRRGWVLPVIAVGLWGLVALVIGEAYPAFYQRFIVQPEESGREAQSIANNIEATRFAYGLDGDHIEVKRFDYTVDRDEAASAVTTNPDTIRNIQLLDPGIVGDAFQRLQSGVAPYQFAGMASDRYQMRLSPTETAPTQVVVGNRELNDQTIPQKSWEGLHLAYTHGYGFALSATGAVTTSGAPAFSVSDIPMQARPEPPTMAAIDPSQVVPQVYFGERMPQYSVVGTRSSEFEGMNATAGAGQPYTGTGGVQLDSSLKRAAFWLRFNDFNLLISDYIGDNSRILFVRDIRDRVRQTAPFLRFDADPYPAVVDNRMVYIVDAYTTSQWYPNSQLYGSMALPGGDLRGRDFNYLRNSVKAVVDAYDGTITYYVWDPDDPIIQSYQAIFPNLFRNRADMSADLVAHVRYPQDLFRVQTDTWGRYRLTDPKRWYDRDGAWEPPPEPPLQPPSQSGSSVSAALGGGVKGPRMDPYYVMNKVPGDASVNFALERAYQPYSENDSKNKLTAFVLAKSDVSAGYGKLQVLEMPNDQLDGPAIVSSNILSNPRVSSEITLLAQQGSKIEFGQLILVPVGRAIIYVRPLYVVAEGATPVPEVKRVIVSFNGQVTISPTLAGALRDMLPGSNPRTLEGEADRPGVGGASVPDAGAGTTTTTTPDAGTIVPRPPENVVPPGSGGDVASLVAQADQLLGEAQEALGRQDLGTYQSKVAEATRKLDQAQQLLQAATTTTTTSPPTGGSA